MTPPAPSAAPTPRRFRALRLLGWALVVAGLGSGGAWVWQAQPAAHVSAPVAKAAAGPEPVEEVALRTLRSRLREPAAAAFQEVRVYGFGAPDERAVCGRVAAGRETPPGGADFVVRVILPGTGRTGGAALPVLEEGPGLPRATANARGRYCRDADAPKAPPQVPTATAVSVTAAARPDSGVGGNALGGPVQGGGTAVLLRRVAVGGGGTAVNLRSGPGGGAPVIGLLPRGQVLDVFDRAPGGWLLVGVGEPWGWAHSSLLVGGP